ncbi:hypothetical protein [Campylobacter lari]|uniref:hypothetical protein n=1 Tax=Campylobacter lari TaxID=201 RepID=UPI00057CD95A|nr:hypothetical protein [Campylobacter lari]AJD04381.1 putative capsular polysaccharide biosynthesis protein [Campylobacter lari RM16701]
MSEISINADYCFIKISKNKILDCLILKNLEYNISDFKFFISEDNKQYSELHNIIFKNNEINVKMPNCFVYYIKIPISKNAKLCKNNIYLEFKRIVFALRDDGFANRMKNILDILYLSDYKKYNFGFIWPNFKYKSDKYISHDKADDIFDNEFLDSYLYKLQEKNYNLFFKNNANYINGVNSNFLDFNYSDTLHVNGVNYKEEWRRIKFSKRYTDIIEYINNFCKNNFDNDFIILHLRGEQVIEDEKKFLLFDSYRVYLYPVELAINLIEKVSVYKKIVVISPGNETINCIKAHINNNNIYFANDIRYKQNLKNNAEKDFFDFVLMSKANFIYGASESLYRTLAKLISENNKGDEKINQTYSFDEQYNILINNIDKMDIKNNFKSSSYAYLYDIAISLNKSIEEKIFILKKGFLYDNENLSFKIKLIDLFINSKMYKEAELEIKSIFDKRSDFFKIMRSYWSGNLVFKKEVETYLNFSEYGYPYVLFFASNICKDNGFITKSIELCILSIKSGYKQEFFDYFLDIIKNNLNDNEKKNLYNFLYLDQQNIKNSLSYKLGKSMVINSKSLIGFIRMPFVLSYIRDKYFYKKNNLDINDILFYNLGQEIIKAHKNWYKGGYLFLIFKIIKNGFYKDKGTKE